MKIMLLKRLLPLITLILAGFFLAGAGNPPPTPASPQIQAELSKAYFQRISTPANIQSLTLDLFTPELDSAYLTPDGSTAVLWLALRDDSGHLLATEPGLALARHVDGVWQVILPGDSDWEETISNLPTAMLPTELNPASEVEVLSSVSLDALSGYYLPYAAGTARHLEGSISHFQNIPELGYPSCSIDYCHYAYDFTDAWHFPLLASKGGTVVGANDSCTDGSTSCTNYIVLYNANDHAYQIYLHLAHGTIPDKLTSGTFAKRGQYLGDTDDTGYSTSQHVHFMVTNSIWMSSSGYYWGQSVDVRFTDVAINNGIPRTCYEVTRFPIYDGATQCIGNKSDPRNPGNDWFVSGNIGAYPPTGSLTRPAAGETVASGDNPIIDVTASVHDDVRVTAVRLVANIGGQWVEIGPKVSQPEQPGLYNWDVDLCAAGPLNGPLEVAVRAWDYEGNVSAELDAHTIQVDHACPPPSSQLNPAETFNSTAVHLTWNASSAGVDLAGFELQWRKEPGGWDAANTLSFPASQRSAWFVGQPGNTYSFRLRAVDVNGQFEPWPDGDLAETSAVLPATCTPDVFEIDDDPARARVLAAGKEATGNICSAGNADWFSFKTGEAGFYRAAFYSLNGGAAARITIYGSDGETVVSHGGSGGVGQDGAAYIYSDSPGIYFIKIEPLYANLVGTDAEYGLVVSKVKIIFFPHLSL